MDLTMIYSKRARRRVKRKINKQKRKIRMKMAKVQGLIRKWKKCKQKEEKWGNSVRKIRNKKQLKLMRMRKQMSNDDCSVSNI